MNTIPHSRVFNLGSNADSVKQDVFVKRVAARTKEFHDHYIKYYSKVSDGLSTAIGRQVRGITKKSDDNGVIGLLKNPILASMLFNNTANWDSLKKILELISPSRAFGQVKGHTPTTSKEHDSLNENVTPHVEHVSDAFSKVVDEYMSGGELAANATASNIADSSFVGPLRPAMQSITNDFMAGTISKGTFEDKASSTLLEYQGIVYSKTNNDYAIDADKLNNMRTSFEASTGQDSLGSHPVFVFKNATQQVYSIEPQAIYKPVLQPIPAPAPTI